MFLNESKFISQVKKAYKTIGVTIADYQGRLVIDISNVVVAIDYLDVSNRIKGLVMELGGSFPKSESAYYISKDNPQPHYNTDEQNKFIDKIENAHHSINKLHISPFIQGYQNIRLLHTNYNKIFGIREELRNLIERYDETSHSEPTGPAYSKTVEDGIYWTGENGIVMILPSVLKESDFITALESVDIQEMIRKGTKPVGKSKEVEPPKSTEETYSEG